MSKRIAIIGAGLSGLYAAYLLKEHFDVTIYEARERIGGRILCTPEQIDLGPTWVWTHQQHILKLAQTLGLPLFEQFEEGLGMYEDPQRAQRFKMPSNPPSGRFIGSVTALCEALYSAINAQVNIAFNTTLSTVSIAEDITLSFNESANSTVQSDYLLLTMPPRVLTHNITFVPPISDKKRDALNAIPTWMGSSAKAVITYETPFWREMGLCGFAMSHIGPLGEIHDACVPNHAALFGFFNAQSPRNDKQAVIAQLERLFGKQAANPLSVHIKDWQSDPLSSAPLDAAPLANHPQYGFPQRLIGANIFCCSTESSAHEGGYLEGALNAAQQCANTLKTELF